MNTKFLIIMGVSGSGKTSFGKALAQRSGWMYYDADDFHTPENIARMTSGIPLDDADRAPWLAKLHDLIHTCLSEMHPAVLACSALKERYRQALVEGNPGVQIVYLKGSYELIWPRLANRKGHYMKAEMLQSQFAALEEPQQALVIDAALPEEKIVGQIITAIQES
jgi:gluconokinase